MTARRSGKRVLLLANHLPDGGLNTHMMTLGSALMELGWELALCSGGPLIDLEPSDLATAAASDGFPPSADHYRRAGIAHFEVAVPDRPRRLRDLPHVMNLPLAMWQVADAVRRFRPLVLHTHNRQMGWYARAVESLTGRPFISTIHNPMPAQSRLWVRTTFFGSTAVAVSSGIRDLIISDYGVDPDRVRVVLPGSDADHFRPPTPDERRLARERFGIEPGRFVLAFIGSLNSRKRPDTFIHAVGDVVASGHDIVALVAGRGALEEAIRSQADRLAITTNVRFLGHHDAREVLWAADALALPSESEGSPLVLGEAMLCGVVPMSTPVGAADRFTPDVTGIVFPVGGHAELARGVTDLIERPDFREAMVARALEDARNRFTSEQMARTIEEIYMDAVAGRR